MIKGERVEVTMGMDSESPCYFGPRLLPFRPEGEISTGRNPLLIAPFTSQVRKINLVAVVQTGNFPGESLENCEMPLPLNLP